MHPSLSTVTFSVSLCFSILPSLPYTDRYIVEDHLPFESLCPYAVFKGMAQVPPPFLHGGEGCLSHHLRRQRAVLSPKQPPFPLRPAVRLPIFKKKKKKKKQMGDTGRVWLWEDLFAANDPSSQVRETWILSVIFSHLLLFG